MLTLSDNLSGTSPAGLSVCLLVFLASPFSTTAMTLVRLIFCCSAKPEAWCAYQCILGISIDWGKSVCCGQYHLGQYYLEPTTHGPVNQGRTKS